MKESADEVKTNTDWEKARMDLYCGVYLSIANHPTASQSTADKWARNAVKDFETQFPKLKAL